MGQPCTPSRGCLPGAKADVGAQLSPRPVVKAGTRSLERQVRMVVRVSASSTRGRPRSPTRSRHWPSGLGRRTGGATGRRVADADLVAALTGGRLAAGGLRGRSVIDCPARVLRRSAADCSPTRDVDGGWWTLSWPGARNLRDLGGRKLRGGGVTASGQVWRSGAAEYLTDQGWAAAKAAGLRTVVDLRNAPAETQRTHEHPVVRPESGVGLTFVAAPTEDPDDDEFLRVCGPWLDHPRSWVDNARIASTRITRVMRTLAGAETGVLIHCAGGRDRTGMISAMLLALTGADEDAIVEDYADGWRGAGAYAGHGWAYDVDLHDWRQYHQPASSAEDLERQLAERIPALRDWIAAVDMVAYLGSIGLTDQEIDALKALLRG